MTCIRHKKLFTININNLLDRSIQRENKSPVDFIEEFNVFARL